MTRVALKHQLIKWFSALAVISFIALWAGSYLAQGLYDSLNFDGFPADGPFQLFNPLRRIADGQAAGVQFQFFHGLGVPFLHYPLFWLFGKSIFASELSRHLTSLLCYLVSLFAFAYAVTRRDHRKALYFVALAICLSEFINLNTQARPENTLVLPGNSLLGVRSTLPVISFALLVSRVRPPLKAVLVGLCLALSLFFGTEHGMALVVSLALVGLMVLASSGLAPRPAPGSGQGALGFRFFLLALISAGCSIFVIYRIGCGPEGIQALKYNLVEVPKDQFWYFGVPPNNFASTLGDFFRASARGVALILIVVLWLSASLVALVRAGRNRHVSSEQLTAAVMLAYGALSCASCLGMLENGYLAPICRVVVLALLMTAFREDWLGRVAQVVRGQKNFLRVGILSAALFSLGVAVAAVCLLSVKKLPPMATVTSRRPVAQLSILWNKYLAQVTRAIDDQTGAGGRPTIWSTYSGLLEERYQVFHPREDYIIHALGPERRGRYLAAFNDTRPDFVQTIRRSLFLKYADNHDYEQWLRNTSWGFYETVLRNYEVLTVTDRSVLWKRKASPWALPDEHYDCFPVTQGSDYFEIPKQYAGRQSSLLVVKLKYRVNNPWRRVPVLGSLPRFLVVPENASADLPVSLPPYAEETRFPIMFQPGAAPRLRFKTLSLVPGASYTVEEVQLKTLELTQRHAIFLED